MRSETEDSLAERIAEFRRDPEKLQDVQSFVQHLIQQAEKSAESRLVDQKLTQNEQRQDRERAEAEAAAGAKRRFGTRARGFMVRLFDALCHCSQTAAAAARHHTDSLRAASAKR